LNAEESADSTSIPLWISDLSRGFDVVVHGRLTLKRPWELGPRTIDDHLLWLVERGQLHGQVAEDRLALGPNQFLLVPPGIFHRITLADEGPPPVVSFLRFHLDGVPRLRATYLHTRATGAARRLLQSIFPGSPGAPPPDREAFRYGLAYWFSLWLSEAERNPKKRDETLEEKATAWARRELHRRFSLGEWAAALGLNAEYFSRRFRELSGSSPWEWLKRERIRLACVWLLESNTSLTELADRLGYRDLFYFSRQFKDLTGASPSRWRSQHRAAGDVPRA